MTKEKQSFFQQCSDILLWRDKDRKNNSKKKKAKSKKQKKQTLFLFQCFGWSRVKSTQRKTCGSNFGLWKVSIPFRKIDICSLNPRCSNDFNGFQRSPKIKKYIYFHQYLAYINYRDQKLHRYSLVYHPFKLRIGLWKKM